MGKTAREYLFLASTYDHIDLLNEALKVIPKARLQFPYYQALYYAAQSGAKKTIELILPLIDFRDVGPFLNLSFPTQ